jgi:hypothetical protein
MMCVDGYRVNACVGYLGRSMELQSNGYKKQKLCVISYGAGI